jgi:hypothetical protein
MVWSPTTNEVLFEGIQGDEPFHGNAFSSNVDITYLLVLGFGVPVRDNVCVPVLVGGQRTGWVFAKTLVRIAA